MTKKCEQCGAEYSTRRPDSSKFCSAKCRNRHQRGHAPVSVLPPRQEDPPAEDASLASSIVAELRAGNRLDTWLGRMAVQAARRIDESNQMNGYASLMKQLTDTMERAMAGVVVSVDHVDELTAWRDRIRTG